MKAHRKPLLWPGPGVPVGEVALALGCLLGKVFGILEGFGFGAFAGWQTAALKAHRKSLLWPWPWGACWGSCLRVKVWRVWRVLEALEGLESFGAFAGWQTAALKAHRKPLLWPWPWGACLRSGLGPGVPAGDGVWMVWRVLEGLEGLESFGAFAGWQTAALKAHRKPLLWPGPGVPVGEGVWNFGGVGAFAGWQTAALKAHRKSLLWPSGACWGRCLEGLAGFGRFGGFGEFWRVLERLRAGKRQL